VSFSFSRDGPDFTYQNGIANLSNSTTNRKEQIMQSRNFLFLLFILFGGLVLLTSCAPKQITAAGTVNYPVVRVHVTGNDPNSLNITTAANTTCAGPPKPNCINVPEFDKAVISFVLTPRTKWRFSEFKICVGATKATQVCSLNAYQQAEFEASVQGGTTILNPASNGVIELAPLAPNLNDAFTAFEVLDHNWVAGDYFYSIKVCPTGDPVPEDDCVWTDPPIINGGKGGRGGGN
jgi:hypothetical protein